MSLGWVIAGTLAEAMLTMVLLMLAVFAGGGAASGTSLSNRQIQLLDLSMLALPASSVIGAGMVIYLYCVDAGPWSYAWYGLPAVAVALYSSLLSSLKRR